MRQGGLLKVDARQVVDVVELAIRQGDHHPQRVPPNCRGTAIAYVVAGIAALQVLAVAIRVRGIPLSAPATLRPTCVTTRGGLSSAGAEPRSWWAGPRAR